MYIYIYIYIYTYMYTKCILNAITCNVYWYMFRFVYIM